MARRCPCSCCSSPVPTFPRVGSSLLLPLLVPLPLLACMIIFSPLLAHSVPGMSEVRSPHRWRCKRCPCCLLPQATMRHTPRGRGYDESVHYFHHMEVRPPAPRGPFLSFRGLRVCCGCPPPPTFALGCVYT